ncbi:MAG: hypothetical protein AB1646_09600 [Thermodesulfobacteriota bacterium]
MPTEQGILRRAASRMVGWAHRITPDHHSQGVLFVLLCIIAVMAESVLMGIWLTGYALMHLCYGGAGTFQRPLLEGGRSRGVLDIVVVSVGTLCLALYVISAAVLIVLRVAPYLGTIWSHLD